MADDVNSLILEHLRHLRRGQERLGERFDVAVARLGSIETQVGILHPKSGS